MSTSKEFEIEIKGMTPLIMHSDTLCNPLHPLTKELKKISSLRTKKDEHYEEMAEIQFISSIYYSEDIGIYMPSKCLFGSMQAAARKFKLGIAMKAVLLDNAIGYPLIGYKKTPLELWETKSSAGTRKYEFTETVVVNRSRILRTRALFQTWKVRFTGTIMTDLLSIEQLNNIVETAGYECGLCELRPQKASGAFGRFSLESFKIEGKEYVQKD